MRAKLDLTRLFEMRFKSVKSFFHNVAGHLYVRHGEVGMRIEEGMTAKRDHLLKRGRKAAEVYIRTQDGENEHEAQRP